MDPIIAWGGFMIIMIIGVIGIWLIKDPVYKPPKSDDTNIEWFGSNGPCLKKKNYPERDYDETKD